MNVDAEGDGGRKAVGRRLKGPQSTFRDFFTTMFVALVIAAIVRTFLFQPFYIPSASMYPTLHVDDKIIVSKLEPGIFELQRGDVVVFEDPGDWLEGPTVEGPRFYVLKALSYVGLAADPDGQFLVKRIIGLPGDRVECLEQGGQVLVNDVPIDDSYINPEGSPCNYEFSVQVPPGKLWMLGDNRTASADSAYHDYMDGDGFVPVDAVQGKATYVVWPISHWRTL